MFNGDVGYCMMELLLQHGARQGFSKHQRGWTVFLPRHGRWKLLTAPNCTIYDQKVINHDQNLEYLCGSLSFS
jgi:hypothetical protein